MNLTKVCTKCNVEYPASLEFFYKHREGKFGLNSVCKICELKKAKEYRLKNLEKIKAKKQIYYLKNKEHINAKTTEWINVNREARRLIARKYTRKYRAVKTGNMHEDWTETQLFELYGMDCYLCNQPIDFDAPKRGEGSELSSWPDHKTPTSRGGSNILENIRPCHRRCNESKGNKTYEEYILTKNSQEIVTIK